MSPTLKSQLSHSVAKARREDGDDRGAVAAFLDGMLAGQAAASRAMAENPEPRQPVGYDEFELPELTSLEDDEGDDEDEGEPAYDQSLTERQAITADIYEAMDVDREYRGDDE